MGKWTEVDFGESSFVGYLQVFDQDGKEIDDEDIVRTALAVYSAASDTINELLIPGLNDVLYKERKFHLDGGHQDIYEEHGFEMMRSAYKLTAYAGLGKVPGKDLLVYPIDPVDIYNGYFGSPSIRMDVAVLEL